MAAEEGSPTEEVTGLKNKFKHVLNQRWVEVFILVLVLLDVIFVSIEGGIDHELFCINGKVVPRPSSIPAEEHHEHESLIAEPSGWHVHKMRLRKASPTLSAISLAATVFSHSDDKVLVCDTKHGHHAEHIMHTCHFWSIVILTIFVIELAIKWAVIPGYFNSKLHVLDMVVVTISLIIDAIVLPLVGHGAKTEEEMEAIDKEKGTILMVTALLIFSRFWRIVRIAHGLYEQYEHIADEAEEKGRKEEEKVVDTLRLALVQAGRDPDAELARLSQPSNDVSA